MAGIKPLPSIYFPDFIAATQEEGADNPMVGDGKQAPSSRSVRTRDLSGVTGSIASSSSGLPILGVTQPSFLVSTTPLRTSSWPSSSLRPAPVQSSLSLPFSRDSPSSTEPFRIRSFWEPSSWPRRSRSLVGTTGRPGRSKSSRLSPIPLQRRRQDAPSRATSIPATMMVVTLSLDRQFKSKEMGARSVVDDIMSTVVWRLHGRMRLQAGVDMYSGYRDTLLPYYDK